MYDSQPSALDKLTGTIDLTANQASVIKQTYLLLGVSVLRYRGRYIGATSETLVRFFSTWIGWIAAILLLNIVPRIAIAARNNPALGVTALVADGFLWGIALSPILFFASRVAPVLIMAALMITAVVFIGITAYVMMSGRTFSAPKGLMMGLFFAVGGAIVLDSFMHIGVLGMLVSAGIGIMGVLGLVYSTSGVLRTTASDSPIPGALLLFCWYFQRVCGHAEHSAPSDERGCR